MDTGADDHLRVTGSVRIPRAELAVRFSPSGGSGGQHANKVATRVELTFDVEASTALTDVQRDRVRSQLGAVVRVVADDERSQRRNRALAEERLVAKLNDALHVRRPRRLTRPTAAGERRRRDSKQRRSAIKRTRRRPAGEDD